MTVSHTAGHRPIRCPLCRHDPVALLLVEPLDPAMGIQLSDLDDRALQEIARYNRAHSGAPVGLAQRIQDAPHLLARLFRTVFTWRSHPYRLFLAVRLLLALAGGLAYVIMPFDILPESALGLVGLIDDALVWIFILLWLASVCRGAMIAAS